MSENQPAGPAPEEPPTIRFGRFSLRVPGTKRLRTVLGAALCIGGLFGWLPILGFWMLPLGLLVLSIDFHPIRRLRRRMDVWWGRRKGPNRDGTS